MANPNDPRDEFTIYKVSHSRDSVGGIKNDFTRRDNIKGVLQELSSASTVKYEKRGLRVSHVLYVTDDPELVEGDKIRSVEEEKYFLVKDCHNLAGRGIYWHIGLEESK